MGNDDYEEKQELKKWENVFKKSKIFSNKEFKKYLNKYSGTMFSIFKYREYLSSYENSITQEDIVEIKNTDDTTKREKLEIWFLEPINESKFKLIKNTLNDTSIFKKMVEKHNKNKKLRILRILNQF